jgi:serine/threonine protein kinase
LSNFLERFRIESRLYEHFYRCIDKKKRIYNAVKIVNKKNMKLEGLEILESEIEIYRNGNNALIPKLKRVYEDDNCFYISFLYFHGEDL